MSKRTKFVYLAASVSISLATIAGFIAAPCPGQSLGSGSLPPEPGNGSPGLTQPPAQEPGKASPSPESAPAAGVAEQSGPAVSPGPLEADRRKLLETIMAAKQYGFGIAAYLNAYQALDDRVKAGASEPEVKGRLDSIVNGLDEQLKRSKQLKIQKPAPPIAASSPPPSSLESAASQAGLKLNGSNADDLISKLKDKWFGGEIPDSIKKKIPPGVDPSQLTPEMAKELLKKYGK